MSQKTFRSLCVLHIYPVTEIVRLILRGFTSLKVHNAFYVSLRLAAVKFANGFIFINWATSGTR
jgi:hypothetical protein